MEALGLVVMSGVAEAILAVVVLGSLGDCFRARDKDVVKWWLLIGAGRCCIKWDVFWRDRSHGAGQV
jgi:hypothetical protein